MSSKHLDDLKKSAEMMKKFKAELFETIIAKNPDKVNALHDVLCILTEAPRITNPQIIEAIESAERGDGREFSLPDL